MSTLTKTDAVLAFDTSNYTTSIALMDLTGHLLGQQRQLLSVEDGKRGLRQSEALFQHVKRLPHLMEQLAPSLSQVNLQGVGYSEKPRRVEGSYMPVFLAGEALARSLAASHDVPCYAFSHQEGHIAAGMWSLGLTMETPFYALHLSGGTTELLKVTPVSAHTPQPMGYQETIVGEISDISLGQLIDRVGVAMGYAFPAGPALEQLALTCQEEPFDIPFSIKSNKPSATDSPAQPLLSLSLSGPETFVQRLIPSASPELVALSVFHFAGQVLARLMKKAQQQDPLPMLLSVGGVASNAIVRNIMAQELKSTRKGTGLTLHFARPEHCSDNAIGTAALTVQSLKQTTVPEQL